MKVDDFYSRGCPVIKAEENPKINTDFFAKLSVHDWLNDIQEANFNKEIVEIRFKNTRKGYYQNVNQLRLKKGDIVAVEASPGHDIGIVSLTGDLVYKQLIKYNIDLKNAEFKKIYRFAKAVDLEKWFAAIELEHSTMIKTRKIAENLKLDMKIGDVEYQGDKTKAIFYYIAEDRVDFRELIKVLAEEFKIRIEMKQIGARQEAGRIGGIGPCGRELCCTTWMTNFVSVTTNAARYQDISLNPQKLAGQCSKLKCCLNYELPCYLDALKDFPDLSVTLETDKGKIFSVKRDIYRKIMWFSFDPESPENPIPLSVETIKEYLKINEQGQKIILSMHTDTNNSEKASLDFYTSFGEESLTRFDKNKNKQHKHKKHKNRK